MQLFYHNLGLHELGEFAIAQTRDYEEGQRVKVTLRVQLDILEEGFAANYDLFEQLREALRTQQGVLRWHDDEINRDYVNQTVTVEASDLPESWGAWHQQVNLVFSYYEQNLNAQNLGLIFRPSGPVATPLVLGNVTRWREETDQARPSPLHSVRDRIERRVQVSGLLLGDPTVPLAARRTALQLQLRTLDILNDKDGWLEFGAAGAVFKQVVRVTNLTAEADQLHHAIPYSFTATYNVAPDESDDYAHAEYTADQRDGQTGEQFLTVGGKVTAVSEAVARAKLAQILTAQTAAYGYAAAQGLRAESSARSVEGVTGDGTIHTELTFGYEWRKWRSDNQRLMFRKTGGSAARELGHVRTWHHRYGANRFTETRSQRRHAAGVIEATGTWAGDPALTLEQRRTALIAQVNLLLAEVNGADGTLAYNSQGTLTDGQVHTVRVEDFRAEVNQAVTGVDWSIVAQYSLFPNEAGYAVAEFNVTPRTDPEQGEETLALAGTITAQSKSAATAKLNSLRTAVLAEYGYGAAQATRTESTFSHVYANGDKTAGLAAVEAADGTTFLQLAFNEEYRKRLGSALAYNVTIAARDDTASGLIATTYAGYVTASGQTADGAYAAALAQAQALGAGKEAQVGGSAFLRSSEIAWTKRQTNAGAAEEFVRLEFSYEYQSKIPAAANRGYLEVAMETSTDAFGVDSENVSGYAVAATHALAEALYRSTVRDLYNTALVRNERLSRSHALARNGTVAQEHRLEFSFAVHVPKSAGKTSYKYGVSTEKDFLQLTLTTRVTGIVLGANAAAASLQLSALLAAVGLINPVSSSVTTDREWTAGLPAQDNPAQPGVFVSLSFDFVYVQRLLGVTGLLEMSLSEEIQYSGVRWVVQPLPRASDGTGGVSLLQDAGLLEGQRLIRGTVTAPTLGECEAWAKRHRVMLTGPYTLPERWSTDFEFVPRVDGIAREGLAGANSEPNVRVWRLNFTFGEILPNAPAPA